MHPHQNVVFGTPTEWSRLGCPATNREYPKVVHARPIVERVQVEPAGAPPAGAAAAGVSIAGHFFNNLRVVFVCKMEEE